MVHGPGLRLQSLWWRRFKSHSCRSENISCTVSVGTRGFHIPHLPELPLASSQRQTFGERTRICDSKFTLGVHVSVHGCCCMVAMVATCSGCNPASPPEAAGMAAALRTRMGATMMVKTKYGLLNLNLKKLLPESFKQQLMICRKRFPKV